MTLTHSSPGSGADNRPLTAGQLRRRLEDDLGIYLNSEQLEKFLRVGLVPKPAADGTWTEDVIPHVKRAHELGKQASSLQRRVILRAAEGGNVVPNALLLKAMTALVTRIRMPADKLRRVLAASTTSQRWIRAEPAQGTAWRSPRSRRPPHKLWRKILLDADLTLLHETLFAAALLDAHIRYLEAQDPTPEANYEEIPKEERLVILPILHLHETARQIQQGLRRDGLTYQSD